MKKMKTLAITLGDRYGIGPELVVRLVPDLLANTAIRTVIVGDFRVFEDAAQWLGETLDLVVVPSLDQAPAREHLLFLDRPFNAEVGPLGQVSERSGAEMLDTLSFMIELIKQARIDGMLYAPLNKQAMRDAGHGSGDELDFLASRLPDGKAAGELNVLDDLWTARVTSHVPLSQVASLITQPAVERSVRLIAATMRRVGVARPRIAIAALNPHAGENGLFGREEIDVLAPVVEALRAEGEDVSGPFPADTVFPRARSDGFNAIVTMYHDQGQIALKSIGLGKSVTALAGLSVPITTPGHGTAYDLVGKGVAEMGGMRSALALCRSLM